MAAIVQHQGANIEATSDSQGDAIVRRTADGDSSHRRLTVEGYVVGGGLHPAHLAKTAGYTITVNDTVVTADCSAGAFTFGLPAAADNAGQVVLIERYDATPSTSVTSFLTIDGNASETINGDLAIYLTVHGEAVLLECDGAGWKIINRFVPLTTVAKSAAFNVAAEGTTYLVTSASAYTVTLMDAAKTKGKPFRFIKVDAAGFGFVLTPPSGTINGSATKTTSSTQWTQTTVISDGTNYFAF